MKTILAFLLLASVCSAQDFRYESRRTVNFWYYESVPDYGYGYGYRPFFPTRRYQYYQPQTFVPMSWGSIPGYSTNGYFVPGVYSYGW